MMVRVSANDHLDGDAVVPEDHALLPQLLPDASGQLGEHVYQGGHQFLPDNILNVDEPSLEAVVDSNANAVGHKLVRLHLVELAKMREMWISGTLSSSRASRSFWPGSHSVMKVPNTWKNPWPLAQPSRKFLGLEPGHRDDGQQQPILQIKIFGSVTNEAGVWKYKRTMIVTTNRS